MRLGPGLPLVLGGPAQRVGPAGQGPDPLLQGPQRQPGVHLGRPGQPGRLGRAGPARPDRARRSRPRPGQLQPVLQVGQPGRGRGPGPPRPGAIACGSRSASPRADRAVELSWPSSSASAAIAASDSCSRASVDLDRLAGRPRAARSSSVWANRSRSQAWLASASRCSASSIAAWTSIRLGCAEEPPAAKWALSTSPSRVTAIRSGSAATRSWAAGRSSTTATLRSTRSHAPAQLGGHLDHVDRVRAPAGSVGQSARLGRSAPAPRRAAGRPGPGPRS